MNEMNLELDRQPSDPTQDQIRRRADAIRSDWSRNVTARRQVTAEAIWRPPLVFAVDLVRELNALND